jgi:hypothetical protein
MFFKRKQVQRPQGPRVRVELVEYIDNETAKKHWDVRCHTRGFSGLVSMHSITDDYGFQDYEEAQKAYHRRLAIERGELKVGLSRYTLAEAEVP